MTWSFLELLTAPKNPQSLQSLRKFCTRYVLNVKYLIIDIYVRVRRVTTKDVSYVHLGVYVVYRCGWEGRGGVEAV